MLIYLMMYVQSIYNISLLSVCVSVLRIVFFVSANVPGDKSVPTGSYDCGVTGP